MKSVAYRLMLSAVSVLTASVLMTNSVSVMYGQAGLIAHVPFTFKAGSATLEAGYYTVASNSLATDQVLLLHNTNTAKDVLMPVRNKIYQSKNNQPRIVFSCASDECAISQVYYGSDGWQFSVPKQSPKDKKRTATVYFNRTSALNN